MNQRHFLILLFSVVLLAGMVLMISNEGSMPDEPGGELLLSEVHDRINEVSGVELSSGEDGSLTTLRKMDSGWVVSELSDYPANWSKLRALLASVSDAKVVEIKTSKPEYYAKLGVEDPGGEGTGSTLLTLRIGQELTALIIGNQATSRTGQYVRIDGDPQSLLIDQELDINTDPVFWAENEIVDIGPAQVAGVEIVHADGGAIRVRKVSADETDFQLENLPVDRKIQSSWSVNSLANVFSMLEMDSVEPDTGQSSTELVNVRLLTFSGLVLEAQAFNQGDSGWIRLKASAPQVPESHETAELELQVANELVVRAEKINQKVRSWVYRLPVSKFEAMTQRLEQILEPLADEENTES